MKKNKKIENGLIANDNTFNCNHSVGEFIEILKEFPMDGKIKLNGSVSISNIFDDPNAKITIAEQNRINNENIFTNEELFNETNNRNGYLHDTSSYDDNYLNKIRKAPTNDLIDHSITTLNDDQIAFENNMLKSYQIDILNEIRDNNAYIAECIGEMHRREILALLEYNTQCLAHFGAATNSAIMCEIVNKNNK